MTDLGELYLLFLVLYLFECLAWVPKRAVGFFTWAGRWRARAAFRPNSGWSVAVVLGKPWPPMAPPWFAEPLPFALDPSGLTLIEGDRRHITWETVGPIEARGHHLNASDFSIATGSRNAAVALAGMLEKIRTVPAKKREAELRKVLDRRFDIGVPRTRRERFAKATRAVRTLSNALWLSLFGGLGAAVVTHNMLVLLVAAGLSLLLWPANSVALALCLRKLDWLPAGEKPEGSKRWVAFLSPISGVRAADLVARESWADVEPLAVAADLLSPEDLARFVRPLLVASEPGSAELSWWRAENRQRIERLLASKKLTVAEILAPPARESDRVQRYCPACLAQFADESLSHCPNDRCVDVPLRHFPTETPT